jgi:hypothetical protein
MLQAMLGLYPFAPANALLLARPRLPAGTDELTLRGLRVGEATVSLRCERRPDGTASHEVVEQDGPLLVVQGGPPVDGAGDSTGREALATRDLEHAPGRGARALRMAMPLEGGS